MPNKCVVCGARRDKKSRFIFHRFPKVIELRKQWVQVCKIDEQDITSDTIICSQHFKVEDFDESAWPKRKLRAGVVLSPSIYFQAQKEHHASQSTEKQATQVSASCTVMAGLSSSSTLVVQDTTSTAKDSRVSPEGTISTPCNQNVGVTSSSTIPPCTVMASMSTPTLATSGLHIHANSSTAIDSRAYSGETPLTLCTPDVGISSPSTSYSKQPRYVGDLEVGHFSTPRKAKRNLEMLTDVVMSQKKKIKVLQQQKRRLHKQINDFKDLLHHLTESKLISEDSYMKMMENTPDQVKHIVSRQLKSKNAKYDAEIRAFALTLHFYSPKAYSYVRKTFSNLLPHPSTIQRWYSVLEGEPGFTQEAFQAIKGKTADKKVFVNITVDEIRQFVEWNGKTYEGFTELGTSMESSELATSALVFMAVALNASWKIPIGYFLIKSLGADERANLTKTCLELLYETGAECYSITFVVLQLIF